MENPKRKFKVLTLNNIAEEGLERLPKARYTFDSKMPSPDAILLRSYKMHDISLPDSLLAVARAGAGVNNIPVDKLSGLGVPVFNAPGANANAVKELVIGAMLMSARNLSDAWDYVRKLGGDKEAISREVELGKKQYVGFELPSRTLGVIGLGAVGLAVLERAVGFGLKLHVVKNPNRPDSIQSRLTDLNVEMVADIDNMPEEN